MAQEKIVVFNITNQTTEEAVVFSAQMYDWKIEWLEGKLEMAEGKEVVKLQEEIEETKRRKVLNRQILLNLG